MRLGDFIQANTKKIAKEWESFARSCFPVTSSISKLVLRDHIDEILVAVANDVRESQRGDPVDQCKGRGEEEALDQAGQGHAGQRVDVGFGIDQATSEFRALRASIVRLWEESSPEPADRNLSDLIRFNEAIDHILIESIRTYTRRLDSYREQFLAILGHDLRNPLGAILMSADQIRRAEGLDERYAQASTRILNSAVRMSRLVNDLLDLTRARLGARLPITWGPVDLGVVCRRVLDELKASHPGRGLQFNEVRLSARCRDLQGEWDGDRLAQVLSNLVANALEYGDEAAPIVVSAEPQCDEVVLAVHNKGPVIPQEDMRNIFEPLVRSGSSRKAQSSSNLGLGLFIVREIVIAHGGEVNVMSCEEQGTTFTVRLPRRPPQAPDRRDDAGSPRAGGD